MSRYLTVDRLEFVVTYRCNSRCRHCQVGPGKRRSRPASLGPDLAARIVEDVARAYRPRSVMTFGGEPLLFPNTVCAIHEAARACGIESRQIITNAGWPDLTLARRLAASGVNGVWISVDAFHEEHIPLAAVERNARALLEAGIGRLAWNPCWLVSRGHDNPWNSRTRALLDALSPLGLPEDEGNVVQPAGNAVRWLAEYLPPRRPIPPTAACGDPPYTGPLDRVTSISIEPDGRVAVCDEFHVGSAAQGPVGPLLQGYDPYRIPEMRAILKGGVEGLAALARSRGVEPDPAGYYSVCDMCKSLRRLLRRVKHSPDQVASTAHTL